MFKNKKQRKEISMCNSVENIGSEANKEINLILNNAKFEKLKLYYKILKTIIE